MTTVPEYQRQGETNSHAGEMSIESSQSPAFQNTEALLRYLYADLTRMHNVASADIVLHPANRSLSPSIGPLRGIEAVQAYEEGLVAATMGTLEMEVESITANSHFGAVLGTLRARKAQDQEGQGIAMPFCGLFRFVDNQVVEHWENAAEPARLMNWLVGTA